MNKSVTFKILALILCLISTPVFVLANTMTEEDKIQQKITISQYEESSKIKFNKSLIDSQKKSYKISAKAYGAFDINKNKSITGINKDKILPIASVTKLMNAVIAKENIKTGQTLTIEDTMLDSEGQSPVIYTGLNISFEDLLKASLTQSVNDAAKSISYFVGEKKFINLMNKKAKELGMKNTTFVDTNGLNLKNKSSVNDLTKLVAYVYKNHPELLETTKDNNFWLPDKDGKLLKFYNMNNFYNYPKFIGGKTGYLPKAGQSIASVFNVAGRPIIIITLNSKNQQTDTLAILNKIK